MIIKLYSAVVQILDNEVKITFLNTTIENKKAGRKIMDYLNAEGFLKSQNYKIHCLFPKV